MEDVPTDTATMIEFKLKSDEDLVVHNGVVTTIGKLIADRTATDPMCKVCYHTISFSAEPGKFTLEQEHTIVYQKKDDATEDATQATIGHKVPYSAWMTDVVEVLWVVKWQQKGLMPIKPQVHLKGELELKTGRAVALHKT